MIVPEEDFTAAVTGTVEPKNHFLHFTKSAVFEKCQKKKLRGNGGAACPLARVKHRPSRQTRPQSPSSCQRTHFPILGKVWSPGESCASYPEFFGLRKRWSLLSIVKAGKAKLLARLINVVRASHKNEEVPPLYKPQSAQGTGKQKTALFQKWHISNFFWMGNTSLLFPFAFSGFLRLVPEDFKLFQLFFEKQVSYGLLSLGLLRGEVFSLPMIRISSTGVILQLIIKITRRESR